MAVINDDSISEDMASYLRTEELPLADLQKKYGHLFSDKEWEKLNNQMRELKERADKAFKESFLTGEMRVWVRE